jgi:uncharacterized protein
MLSPQQVIDRLQLVPLAVEGGYYRETYRSALQIPAGELFGQYGSPRNVATAIYYLLTPDQFSALHRVTSDEIFHFYAGDPVEMLQLANDDRGGHVHRIGNDLAAGQLPQIVVPGGVWMGCRLLPGGRWALLGCTVAPGFDYADFTTGDRAQLVAQFPDHADMILALTRP